MHLAEIALSVVLGLLTSFVFFYWQFHLVVPKVAFSEKISRLPAENGGARYRIKYENSGRRAMIEVTLLARLRVRGIHDKSPHNWSVATIPMESVAPRVEPVKKSRVRHVPEIELCKTEFDRTFPPAVVERVHSGAMPLEELFRIGAAAELRVYLFAYDEFSGSRKVFTSKIYGPGDVIDAGFESASLKIAS